MDTRDNQLDEIASQSILADVSPAPAESVFNSPPFSTLIGPPWRKSAGIQTPNSVFSGPAAASVCS